MRYVDGGYASALGVLFVYGVSLVLRRRRLERALEVTERDRGVGEGSPSDRRD